MREFILDGRPMSYVVRSGRSRRRAYLRFNERLQLEVTLPKGCKTDAVELLEKSRNWIRKRSAQLSPLRECIMAGKVMYQGKAYALQTISVEDCVFEVSVIEDSLVMRLPAGGDAKTELRKWMMEEARKHVEANLPTLAQRLGVEYGRVLVRDVRSRWGSCSRKKYLGFNYRLMMLPQDVAEYLMVHELAHLNEFNHSKRFWKIVASACPDYKEKEKKLRGYPPGFEFSLPSAV